MADANISVKLTAVFYADVAGYSRLTCADQEGTHRRVMEALDFVTETIETEGGNVLRYAGDSILAEFSSVVAAVYASGVVQNALRDKNQKLTDDCKVMIRIGVNLGDVMQDRGEIFGDGVNLAARLEAAAAPGGLCISSAVYEQVHGKLDIAFEDGGFEEFKNISRPVHVYRWHPDTKQPAPKTGAARSASAGPDDQKRKIERRGKPSIAVLPFINMSDDPEQEYFSDGITEDLITDLSKVSGLFVIARNTAFTYKNQNLDLAKVAKELGVRHVLEGSVRRMGSRVRITAQLIDGGTNGHIWAERYDRNLEDIFTVQDEVTAHIVEELRVHVTDTERRQMVKKDTENLAAYDDLLHGRELFLKFTPETNRGAEACFRMAIEKDPDYAAAYAEVARVLVQRRNHGWDDTPDETLEEAYRLVRKAVEIDETVAQPHIVKGFVHLWRHEHDLAMRDLEIGLKLDPNHADGHMWKAIVAGFSGKPDIAVNEVKLAMRLNPGSPFWYLFALGNACFAMVSYRDCVGACGQAIAKNPNFVFAQMLSAAAHGHLGETRKASAALKECHRLNPQFSLEWAQTLIPYKDTQTRDRFVSGLEKAGL